MKIKLRKTSLFMAAAGCLLISCCAAAQAPQESAREYYLRGDAYYQQGRFKEAQAEYNKALDILNSKDKPSVKDIPAAAQAPDVYKPVLQAELQQGSSLEYTIGEGDVLQISVWQNADLDQEAIVRPDGRISFPLIGDVQASGYTVSKLDENITERLKEFIRYPEVSISIKKLGGKKVIILGQVTNPGVYSVTGAKTILEAIGLAGGFTRDAVSSSTVVIRGGFAQPQAQRINLSRALKGDMRLNVRLESEDIVFVPRKFISDLNYFLMQIIEPISKGAYANRDLHDW